MQMCVHCKMYVGTSLTAMEIWTSKHDVDICTCVCLYTFIYLYESLDIYTYETVQTPANMSCPAHMQILFELKHLSRALLHKYFFRPVLQDGLYCCLSQAKS